MKEHELVAELIEELRKTRSLLSKIESFLNELKQY